MSLPGERGLTLLELLVALALLSLIGLGLTSTIGTSKRVWEQSERYGVTLEEINTRQLIARVLENAFIEDTYKPDSGFEGTDNTLRFKSNFIISHTSTLNILEVTLQNSADGLVMEINEIDHEATKTAHYSRILQSKITSISYFDPSSAQWRDDWHQPGLPRLVYLQFNDPKWPDLAIHLING